MGKHPHRSDRHNAREAKRWTLPPPPPADPLGELADFLRDHEAYSAAWLARAILDRYALLPRGDGSTADLIARAQR